MLVIGIEGPDETAYSLIRSVRALPRERAGALPAIALTPLTEDIPRERITAEGLQASIKKPIGLSELCEVILRIVTRESSEQDATR